MKRRKLPPDIRKDWRDPNMPVTFAGKVNGINGYHEIDHRYINQYFVAKMNSVFYNPPLWHSDPSYWWSKKR
jgi:hypothetical protein